MPPPFEEWWRGIKEVFGSNLSASRGDNRRLLLYKKEIS